MPTYRFETSRGEVVYSALTDSPNVLLIHGLKRTARQLATWAARIPDIGLVYLPGHNGAPDFSETSVEAWADGLRQLAQRLPNPPLIIAESLGAVIALTLPARAVIAVEPLLSTHDLWPLRRSVEHGRARGLEVEPELLGLFVQSFHWVLERIRAPTLVLAGSVPLMPEREVWPEPSVLSDDDLAAYAAHPMVEAHRIAGGHALLSDNPDGVMEAAAGFMARHGYLGGEP